GSSKKLVDLYILALDYYGIDKAQVFSVIPSDNEFMAIMKKYGRNRLFPLGMVTPKTGNLQEQLEQVKKLGLFGLKIHPDFQKLDFKSPKFGEIFSFCEQHQMVVISHTGSHANLRDLVEHVKDYPNMPLILGHMGLSPQVEQAFEAAKNNENVYLEISGQGYIYMIQKAIESPEIGPDRILFGSDFPSLAPQVELEKIFALNVDDSIRKKIFFENIAQLYGKLGKKIN
ncbi:MAG: amidohydrolase family protein, partial [Promethearchaeota archaeon]